MNAVITDSYNKGYNDSYKECGDRGFVVPKKGRQKPKLSLTHGCPGLKKVPFLAMPRIWHKIVIMCHVSGHASFAKGVKNGLFFHCIV